jgi:hypothetical protein
MQRLAAAFTLLLFASVAFGARAQGTDRSVGVVAGARGALAHRVAQELEAAGLDVRVRATSAGAENDDIMVIVPEGGEGAIEVWSKTAEGSTLVASIRPEGATDTRVLRAIELVRALALPGRAAPTPPNEPGVVGPPVPAPATAPAPVVATPAPISTAPDRPVGPRPLAAAPVPAIFDAGISPAVGISAQGASFGLEISARVWPHEHVGIGVLADLPLVGARIASDEGVATMRRALFGAELATAPIARTERFSLVLSPGAGFAYVDFSAEAEPGFRARDASAFAGLVYGRAEARVRVFEPLSVVGGGLGGVAFPPVEVRFGGRSVSRFSGTGAVSLGVMVEL